MITDFEKFFIPQAGYQRIFDEMRGGDSREALEAFREDVMIEWFDIYVEGLKELGYEEIGDLESYEWGSFIYSQNHSMKNDDRWWAEHRDNPRIVAVHGYSQNIQKPREHARLRYHGNTYIREYGDAPGAFAWDKGHFIGHKLGGEIDNGIFAQRRDVNRGWGDYKKFYQMERYAQANPGTFVFCRPIYGDGSNCPFYIEYGLLRSDNTWWVEVFPNRYSFTPFRGFAEYPEWKRKEIQAAIEKREKRLRNVAS